MISSFYFRQHTNLYKPLTPEIYTQTWDEEEEYQIHLLNFLYAVTNEGVEAQYSLGASHSAISGGRNKMKGYHAGWPDLQIGWPNCCGMFFLELKCRNGRLHPAQRECHAWIRECGGKIETTRTIKAALDHLISWGMPISQAKYQLIVG